MKKVKVTRRAVYYKVAAVEVSVPSFVEDENVEDWLSDNAHLFADELDKKISEAKYEYEFGITESETRYDVYNEAGELEYGGHVY